MTSRQVRELMVSPAVRSAPAIVQSWLFDVMAGEPASGFAGQPTHGYYKGGPGGRRIGKNGNGSPVRDSERLS
jgi:hypothetical protein